MSKYLTNDQRAIIALLGLPTEYLEEAEHEKMERIFKPGLKELRAGRTWIIKGIMKVLDGCDPMEMKNFEKLKKNYRIKLVPRTSRDPNYLLFKEDDIWALVEHAVTQNCVGCKKTDWKKCELRKIFMSSMEVPAAHNETNQCQYCQ
ncbi:DUF5651 domain-containing protein [Brevibacillus migulae]|uniref:DUF5651 domain-containing protein n=1 Tax=Brevibacillus migulae TaxID=1644114 RepID=UPI00106EC397|nr:DUF5651 domain-containing protein [Brevibacillus migulae]